MEQWIVTIRMLKRNPDHDPRNKKAGPCLVSDHCTDVTGEHHSFLFEGTEEEARSIAELDGAKRGYRLTRLERVV